MNHILVNEGYWPGTIHAIDRQRYYDVLRMDQDQLLELVLESVEQGIVSSNKLYQGIVDSMRGF
jgi:hypothetical protein